jgi:hypothetical protein
MDTVLLKGFANMNFPLKSARKAPLANSLDASAAF